MAIYHHQTVTITKHLKKNYDVLLLTYIIDVVAVPPNTIPEFDGADTDFFSSPIPKERFSRKLAASPLLRSIAKPYAMKAVKKGCIEYIKLAVVAETLACP